MSGILFFIFASCHPLKEGDTIIKLQMASLKISQVFFLK